MLRRLYPHCRLLVPRPSLLSLRAPLRRRAMTTTARIGPPQNYHRLLNEIEELRRLFVKSDWRQRLGVVVLAGGGLVGGCAVAMNWEEVKKKLGRRSAEVLQEGMRDEQLKLSGKEAAKETFTMMLRDEEVKEEVVRWTESIIKKSKPVAVNVLHEAVMEVLREPTVIERMEALGAEVLETVSNDEASQASMGQLLAAGIGEEEFQIKMSQVIAQIWNRGQAAVTKTVRQQLMGALPFLHALVDVMRCMQSLEPLLRS